MNDRIDPRAPPPDQQDSAPQPFSHAQGLTPQQQPSSLTFALGAAPMHTSPAAGRGQAMEANVDPRGPPPAGKKWCANPDCRSKKPLRQDQRATLCHNHQYQNSPGYRQKHGLGAQKRAAKREELEQALAGILPLLVVGASATPPPSPVAAASSFFTAQPLSLPTHHDNQGLGLRAANTSSTLLTPPFQPFPPAASVLGLGLHQQTSGTAAAYHSAPAGQFGGYQQAQQQMPPPPPWAFYMQEPAGLAFSYAQGQQHQSRSQS